MSHLVVCPTQLEAKYGLLILALEEDPALKAVAEVDGMIESSFFAYFPHPWVGGDDEAKVLWTDLVPCSPHGARSNADDGESRGSGRPVWSP